MSKYYRNGTLNDKKIAEDLRIMAEMYENGELVEVRDLALDIVNAIDAFTEAEERRH